MTIFYIPFGYLLKFCCMISGNQYVLALFFFAHGLMVVHSMYSPPYIGLELLRLPTQTPVPDLAFGLYFITKSSRVSFSVSIWDFI